MANAKARGGTRNSAVKKCGARLSAHIGIHWKALPLP